MRILRSADVLSVIDAMWGLVRLREQAALEPIRNLASNPKERLVANNARVAALVLEGDERALLEPLELHDHARVPMSIKGLAYLATPTALAARVPACRSASTSATMSSGARPAQRGQPVGGSSRVSESKAS